MAKKITVERAPAGAPNPVPRRLVIANLLSPEEYKRIAILQKVSLHEIADEIEKSGAIDGETKRMFAAGALRAWADQCIPLVQRKKRGQQPRIDPGTVAIEVAIKHVCRDMSLNRAIEQTAEAYEVSDQTIKNAMGKQGDAALSFVRGSFKPKT